jgi:hypothetical protein
MSSAARTRRCLWEPAAIGTAQLRRRGGGPPVAAGLLELRRLLRLGLLQEVRNACGVQRIVLAEAFGLILAG